MSKQMWSSPHFTCFDLTHFETEGSVQVESENVGRSRRSKNCSNWAARRGVVRSEHLKWPLIISCLFFSASSRTLGTSWRVYRRPWRTRSATPGCSQEKSPREPKGCTHTHFSRTPLRVDAALWFWLQQPNSTEMFLKSVSPALWARNLAPVFSLWGPLHVCVWGGWVCGDGLSRKAFTFWCGGTARHLRPLHRLSTVFSLELSCISIV